MKKSIKYAGIAAATLLAVAPVAAPVVSSTSETAVKAATTDTNTTNMNSYAGQFVDSTLSQTQQGALTSVGKFGKMSLADFNTGYLQFAPYTLNDNDATYNALNNSDTAKATATVSAVTSNGTKVSSAKELDTYLKDSTTKAVTFTVAFNYNDTNSTAASAITKTFTVTKAAVTQTADLTSAAVSYDKTANVAYGTSAADYKLVASANLSVKDNNGTELTSNSSDTVTPSISQDFYTSYNDAYNQTNGTNVSTFNKENTSYYQVVTGTFNADSAFATLLTNHKTTPADYGLTVNGTTPTGSYTDPTSFQTKTNADGTKSFTLIREIKVGSKEAASWTTSDIDGVVTTKSDNSFYTLKNDDNVTVSNRGLGANTAWLTDKVRTNAKGDKQYRVATGEWIDANNVTYAKKGENTGLQNIKTVSGVATLTKSKGYVMTLFGDNGEARNLSLASPSAWRVDRTATDANGNTYYRVATNQWLQAGEGVSYK